VTALGNYIVEGKFVDEVGNPEKDLLVWAYLDRDPGYKSRQAIYSLERRERGEAWKKKPLPKTKADGSFTLASSYTFSPITFFGLPIARTEMPKPKEVMLFFKREKWDQTDIKLKKDQSVKHGDVWKINLGTITIRKQEKGE
jgi:hypothetical protein